MGLPAKTAVAVSKSMDKLSLRFILHVQGTEIAVHATNEE